MMYLYHHSNPSDLDILCNLSKELPIPIGVTIIGLDYYLLFI